jgi:hypothetical protein
MSTSCAIVDSDKTGSEYLHKACKDFLLRIVASSTIGIVPPSLKDIDFAIVHIAGLLLPILLSQFLPSRINDYILVSLVVIMVVKYRLELEVFVQ